MASQAGNGGRGLWSPWRIAGWSLGAMVLIVPLVAMQFTAEVRWSVTDFVFMGVLVLLVGGAFELAARLSDSGFYRAGVGVAAVTSFLLVWINAAAGVIGSERNPLNLLYLGVIGIAVVGGLLGNFRARGMARAMVAAAVAQALMTGVALAVAPHEPPGPFGLVTLHAVFTGLWLTSAWLFRNAAVEQAFAAQDHG
jgi:hypothetical protein